MKEKILEIICPHCRNTTLRELKKHENGVLKEHHWNCPRCVFSWPFGWFDKFTHFEYLVIRRNQNLLKKENWEKNLSDERF